VREKRLNAEAGERGTRRWTSAVPISRVALGPALLCLLAIGVLLGGDRVYVFELGLVGIFAIAAVGQQWILGRCGQASIGAAAFLGIGAFATASLSNRSWCVFPLPIVLAGAIGGASGLLVGLTAVRLRGLYLLLSTLALQFIALFIFQRYAGSAGVVFVNVPTLFGQPLQPGVLFDVVVLLLLAVIIGLIYNAYRSAPGRAWSAIRENESAARVVGVNVVAWKLFAFAGSSAVTAIAGAMYAYLFQSVPYQAFSLQLAISMLVMVYVGGQRSLSGAVLGAGVVSLIPFILDRTQAQATNPTLISWLSTNGPTLNTALYGLALTLVLLFERGGLAALLARGRDRLLPSKHRGAGNGSPSVELDASPAHLSEIPT